LQVSTTAWRAVPSLKLFVGRDADSQHRFAADILQRQVDAVCALVNGHRMSVRREEASSDFRQATTLFVKDGEHTAFGGDVEPAHALIEGEHVGTDADRVKSDLLFRRQVEEDQLG